MPLKPKAQVVEEALGRARGQLTHCANTLRACNAYAPAHVLDCIEVELRELEENLKSSWALVQLGVYDFEAADHGQLDLDV